jgi:hypothetical protein
MMNKAHFHTLLVAFSLAPGMALAVELPQPVIPLFNSDLMTNYAGIDWVENAGLEAPGINEKLVIRPVSGSTNVKSRVKLKLRAKSSSNNSTLGTFDFFVETKSYPNPDTSTGTSYYCEDDGYIRSAYPVSEWFPCDYDINFGVANSGATRYLVASAAVYVWYYNATDGDVDIGKASVIVWDLAGGARLWVKNWNVLVNDWELEDGLSAVGDFLASHSGDEVRIAYWRQRTNNRVEMKYTYFDIATGDWIKEDKFIVPSP